MVLLRVSTWKGVIYFWKRDNLGPKFNRLFWILVRVGKVVCRLDFPEELRQIHNTFHVSQLRKCVLEATFVVPLDDVQLNDKI